MKKLLFLVWLLLVAGSIQAQTELWGMTSVGGNGSGVIFKTDATGLNQQVKYSFTSGGTEGKYPYGNLAQASNGKLYGMTFQGGTSSYGALFEFDPATFAYSKKIDFTGTANGRYPYGSLVQASNGLLYGMTSYGGSNGIGVLFEFNTTSYSLTKRVDFTGAANGSYPMGSLVQASNGLLYGLTYGGGASGDGVLFSFNPSTYAFAKIIDFTGTANGSYPYGNLIQASNGKLYGMTYGGGANGLGTLFEFDPTSGILTKKIDFAGATNGSYPYGSLIQASNGKLYGMTYSGGASNFGTLFEYDVTAGSLTKKIDFTGTANGKYPYGSLVQVYTGKIYGMTYQGGTNNYGVIFEYDPTTFAYVKKLDFNNTNGKYPYYSQFVQICAQTRLTAGVSIAASTNSVCAGTSITYTATPTNGGSWPSYQWQVNGINVGTNSTTNSTYNYVPINGNAVSCIMTSSISCVLNNPAASNTITMNIISWSTTSVIITSSKNPACGGDIVTFTATVTNDGGTPTYQWQVNGANVGSNSSVYSYTPGDGNIINCWMTSSLQCPTPNPVNSNAITETVYFPIVAIASNANPVCAGTSITLTATPSHGGNSPSYQWKLYSININGATNSTYSYVPSNNDALTCMMTSNDTCNPGQSVTSSVLTMIVNPNLPVSVNVTASPSFNVCAGTTVTYTATPTNGGSFPLYHWMIGSTFIYNATNSTYSYVPVNGDAISCIVTSNAICPTGSPATSNVVTMIVNPNLPVGVTIYASPSTTICPGSQANFIANPTNGGNSPTYTWRLNGNTVGTNSVIYSNSNLNNGDQINCIVTSSARCISGNPATSNTLNMTVLPNLPVSVNIALSPSSTICAGTNVSFLATPTNGGSPPAYSWKLNGNTVGGNSSTFATTALQNNDVVNCVMISNVACATGSPATSNSLTMTVNPNLTVGANITADPSGSICPGDEVTFTVSPTNGGTTPTYKWLLNGQTIGGNAPVYSSYTLINGDQVKCILTSNAICPVNTTTTSNTIITTVNPDLPVSISITSGAMCVNEDIIFTASTVNGGLSPTYQWFVNGNPVGENSPVFDSTPLSYRDVVNCVLTSNATCAIDNPATSNSLIVSLNPELPVSLDIEAFPSGYICSGSEVTFIAFPTNSGVSPSYQWLLNGFPIGDNNPVFSYSSFADGDQVSCIITSDAICAINNPATSESITMTVYPNIPVSVDVSAIPSGPICDGTDVTFIAFPTNEGDAPYYQWLLNDNPVGDNSPTYTASGLVDGDLVNCILTSNATCAIENPVTSDDLFMTVNPNLSVSVDIMVNPTGSICAGTTVTFTAYPTNGGDTPTYQWVVNETLVGDNSPVYSSSSLADGDQISCILTSNAICAIENLATSNTILMTVNPNLPVSVDLSAYPSGPICPGTEVTFTASTINGGDTPTYQWLLNGNHVGDNNTVFSSSSLSNDDLVSCILTSNATCAVNNPATSDAISMIVNPNLPVSVDIMANPSGPICPGTGVTFIAYPTNEGDAPIYQWFVNGIPDGDNSPTYFSSSLIDGDQVSCVLMSNATCVIDNPATSNTISMTVNPNLPASVYITAFVMLNPYEASYLEGPICAGTEVLFTAYPTNGGDTPSYQWLVNGNPVGENDPEYSSTSLEDGDQVSCILTSNATCAINNPASSNFISIAVNPLLPVSLIIAANPSGPICDGDEVTFTASPTNGGDSPSYQWLVNGNPVGENSSLYSSSSLVDGDQVSCVLNSNATCAVDNPANSNIIVMTVNPLLPVNVTIVANPSGPICDGDEVTFTAYPTNGGDSPTYHWMVNGYPVGDNSSLYSSSSFFDGDLVSCVLTSNATCAVGNPATSDGVLMTVNPNLPVSIDISAYPAGPICAGTDVTFSASSINEGDSPTYQWLVNGNPMGENNSVFSSSALLDGDLVSCVLTSNATCAIDNPATSDAISMTVYPNLPVSVDISANPSGPICDGTDVTFTATPTFGGDTPTYQWYVNGYPVGDDNPVYSSSSLIDSDIVNCVLTSNATCAIDNPAVSNNISMTVYPNLPVSINIAADPSVPVCAGTEITFTAYPTNGGDSPIYQWLVNGYPVGDNSTEYSSSSFADGDQVSCILTSNATCAVDNPATSDIVTTAIYSLPILSPVATPPTICVTNSSILTVSGADTYIWDNDLGTGEIKTVTPASTTTYNVTGTDINGCVNTASVIVTVNPSAPQVTVSASPAVICNNGITTLTADGATSYYWSNGLGTGNSVIAAPFTTTTYTVTGTTVGCTSSASITVIVDQPQAVSIDASETTICSGNSSILTASGASTYEWSNGLGWGDTKIVSPLLTTIYFVIGTDNFGCSNAAAIIITVNPTPTVTITSNVTTICNGNTSVLAASGADEYIWNNDMGTDATINVSPSSTTTYIVTGTTNLGCSNTASSIITVNPLPTVSITASPQTICNGNPSILTASGALTYNWSNSGTGSVITVSPESTTTYYVTGTDSQDCSNTASITVTVNPIPTVTANASPATICNGASSTLTASGTTDYTWSNGLGNGDTVIVSPTSTTTYTVTGSTLGCVNTALVTVTVNPLPVVTATASPSSICTGFSSMLTASGASSYTWSNGLGNGNPVSVAPISTTTYYVTGTSNQGCLNTATVTVSVNLTPVVTASASPSAICYGSSAILTASGASTYSWSNNLGTGTSKTVSPTATTTYLVTGTSSQGCTNTASVTVTVNPLPNVSAAASPASICAGSSSTLTASGASTYIWSSNLGAGATVVASPITTTTYFVTGTDIYGCSNNASVTVTINTPNVTITASSSVICTGNSSTLTAGGALSYTWSNGLGSGNPVIVTPTATTTYTVTGTNGSCSNTAIITITVNQSVVIITNPPVICAGASSTLTVTGTTNPDVEWNDDWAPDEIDTRVVTLTSTTTYTVTGTTTNGCPNVAITTVFVNPLPTVTATASPTSICTGSSSMLNAGGALTYVWSNSGTDASISVAPTSTTIYTVTGTDINGCSNTARVTLTVNPIPNVTISASANPICYGNSSTLTASGATSYSWSNGLGSSNPVIVSPTTATTYSVTGTSLGCSNTATVTITVNYLPTITVTASPSVMCSGNSSTLSASGANTYTWSNSLGTGSSKVVTPATTTTYIVTGTSTQGCSSSASVAVTVYALPTVTASASPSTICAGSTSVLMASGALTYNWSNLLSGSTINVSPASTTTYTVTGTNAQGCSNTATVTVTVNTVPTVTASASPTAICNGNSSVLTASGASSYTWSNGLGSSNPVSVTPTTTTTYTVTGTTSGCSNTATVTVTVNSLPTVTATASPSAICTGNRSTLTASGANTYSWSNGLGTGSSVNASPTSTTTYTVTGTSSPGCSNTATVTVTVNALPTVAATASPATICVGSSSILTASGASTYNWSNSSSGASITVTPASTTIYTVTGTNAQGCSNTATVTVNVNAIPTVTASASPTTICNGSSSVLTAAGASSYSWSNGLGSSNPVSVTPTTTTTYTVTGTISGCSNTATVTVTVNPIPAVTASASPSSICTGSSSNLTASGASTYSWSNSLGTGSSKTVTPASTTTYTVTGTSALGCSGTASVTVTVNAIPTVTVSASSTTICAGSSSTLTASGASTYTWSNSGTGATITVTPASTSTYTVTGTSNQGCTNTATVTITVNALPTVTASASPTAVCNGVSSTLTAGGASTYSWSNSLGTGATKTVTPTATTTYTVTGTNSSGCANTAIVTVTVNPLPTVTASASPSSICTGSSSTLTAGGASTYSWSNSLGTGSSKTVTPASTTTYTVTGTSALGCSGKATVTVTVNAIPTVTVTASSTTVCSGSPSTLTAGGASTYSWSNSLGTGNPKTVNPTVTTTYSVTGTSASGCTNTAKVTVTVNALPSITATASPTTICAGASSTLTAGGGSTYSWSNSLGSGATKTVTPTTTTTYTVTGTNSNGCTNTAVVTVTVNPLPTVTATANPTSITSGHSSTLTASGASTYAWSNSLGSGNPKTVSPTVTTTYTVTGTATTGCSAKATVTVTVTKGSETTNVKDFAESSKPDINCYPNPFTDKTYITFTLHKNDYVTLVIFDITGKEIQTLYQGNAVMDKEYKVEFNKGMLPAGLYFYRMATTENLYSGKMIIVQ